MAKERTTVDDVLAVIKKAKSKGASRIELCEAVGKEGPEVARALVKLKNDETIYSEGVTRNMRYFAGTG
jgi:copper homeostasis protein CutC